MSSREQSVPGRAAVVHELRVDGDQMQQHSAEEGMCAQVTPWLEKEAIKNPLALTLQYRATDLVDISHGIVSFTHKSDLVL